MEQNNNLSTNQEINQTGEVPGASTPAPAVTNEIKTVIFKGQRHVLVNPGPRWYLQTLDRCKNQYGVLMQEKYTDTLLSVCLAPTMTIEDFGNDIKSLQQAVEKIERFLES